MAAAGDALVNEIKLLGGTDPNVSSNILLRLDGLPRSGYPRAARCGLGDLLQAGHGFCLRSGIVSRNIYAIAKTINALRGVA